MIYLIVAASLLPVLGLIGFYFYLENQDKKRDAADTLAFRAMTAEQRADTLVQAKRDRTAAYYDRNTAQRQWASYKWGYRHNPYNTRLAVARARYSYCVGRVKKLEGIIAELDTPKP